VDDIYSGTDSCPYCKPGDVPAQSGSVDCSVFILMYALYKTFDWEFDFTQLPDAVLQEIFLNVVLEEGDDDAILKLSLVCPKFRCLVGTDKFRRMAHFRWLDSYLGRGKRGEMQGFCSDWCQMLEDLCKSCLQNYWELNKSLECPVCLREMHCSVRLQQSSVSRFATESTFSEKVS
ncbi:hypothetical protein IRJ41_023851, partial [Triplophysa rosa]